MMIYTLINMMKLPKEEREPAKPMKTLVIKKTVNQILNKSLVNKNTIITNRMNIFQSKRNLLKSI